MIPRSIPRAYHRAHLRLLDVETRVLPLTTSRRRSLQRRLARHFNALEALRGN